MPGYVPAQLRGLLLVGTLAGAVALPCAVFAVDAGDRQQDTLLTSAAAVGAPVDVPAADRPPVRFTVAARLPVRRPPARPSSVRASRTRRAVPASSALRPALVVAPLSGTLAERVLAEARRHAGAPYSYGAAGPRRFDCSGFTMYVFGRLGISLPHSSSQQAAVTTRIPDADKQPGDLIFTYHGGTIGHVGIYAGGSQMWAAVESGDVVRLQSFAGRTYSVGRVG